MRVLPALAALLAAPVAMTWAGAAWGESWQLERSEVMSVAAPDGHAYRVMVAWPEGEPPAAGWPVLWVLDGDDNFAIAALTARRLARSGARSGIESGLVIAIESGPLARRVLDYTPAIDGYVIPAGAPAAGLKTGGGDAFLRFIDNSVRPRITARWRIDPARQTLMGHSFGGLLALHDMATGHRFNRYVAVSPSLWFGNGAVTRALSSDAPGTLLLAAGDREGGPSNDGPSALVNRMGERAKYLPLVGQTHGSTMLAAMAQGVAFAFDKEDRP